MRTSPSSARGDPEAFVCDTDVILGDSGLRTAASKGASHIRQELEEEWEQEKKGMLKTWGEEVESLIISYQNDKALWDAKRDELTEELNAVGTS